MLKKFALWTGIASNDDDAKAFSELVALGWGCSFILLIPIGLLIIIVRLAWLIPGWLSR